MRKFLLLFFSVLFLKGSLLAQTGNFFVSNTNNSGGGSLRQAILDANSYTGFAGPSINFVLSTPATISITSPLPTATRSIYMYAPTDLTINGNFITGPIFPNDGISMVSVRPYPKTINFSSTNYTVTSQSGQGSFYQILDYCEQTSVKDYIYFNLPGQAPQTITASSYPYFTFNNPVFIDGSSQPANGYTGNMPRINMNGYIELLGGNSEVYGLTFINNGRLRIYTSSSNVTSNYTVGKATAPNVFLSGGILVQYASNVMIQNNVFGMDLASDISNANIFTAIEGNNLLNVSILNNVMGNCRYGLFISSDTNTIIKGNKIGTDISGTAIRAIVRQGLNLTQSTNLIIGGRNTADRNIICGAGWGIQLNGPHRAFVRGNYIGVDASGMNALYNGTGIQAYGDSICIGGNLVGEGNVIVSESSTNHTLYGNYNADIDLWGGKAYIYGNKIGLAADGTTALEHNATIGICLEQGTYAEIGRLTTGYGNTISSCLYGVLIAYPEFYEYNHLYTYTIRGNSFFNNTTGILTGINPVVKSVTNTQITGTAAALSVIDLYTHNGNGSFQGKTYLGTVNANAQGNWTYNGTLSSPCLITVTATVGNRTTGFSQTYNFGNLGPDITVCKGADAIQLQASGGESYSWLPATGLNNSQSANPLFTTDQSATFIVSVTNNLSCVGNDTIKITVNEPQADVSATITPIECHGGKNGKIALTPQTSGANYTYLWNDSTTTAERDLLVAGTYQVAVFDENQCARAFSYELIDPSKLSNFNLPVSQQNVCSGSSAFAIDGGSPSGGIYSGTFVSNNNFDPTTAGIYEVYYSYTEGNCIEKDTQSVRVWDCLETANVATDSENEITFYPNPARDKVYIQSKQNRLTHLSLYNQYGQKVRTVELNDTEIYFSVEQLPTGLYVLRSDDSSIKFSASLIVGE